MAVLSMGGCGAGTVAILCWVKMRLSDKVICEQRPEGMWVGSLGNQECEGHRAGGALECSSWNSKKVLGIARNRQIRGIMGKAAHEGCSWSMQGLRPGSFIHLSMGSYWNVLNRCHLYFQRITLGPG